MTVVHEIRDVKHEIRDLRTDQREMLNVLKDHSNRIAPGFANHRPLSLAPDWAHGAIHCRESLMHWSVRDRAIFRIG